MLEDHDHHAPSFELFAKARRATASYAAHSLAEIYAVLTRLPSPHRLAPSQVLIMLGSIRDRLAPIALGPADYLRTIESAAASGISGGAVYDALIAACALKAKADVIYTWNVSDFGRLGAAIAGRVRTPLLL